MSKKFDDTADEEDSTPTETDDQPQSDAAWFALIEPFIDIDPADADAEDVIRIAKRHAEQVVERTELEIHLSAIEWAASYELRARHGYERSGFIKLSLHSLETNGWRRMMQTVRHELIHVWQHQQLRTGGHGSSFERWMPVVNVEKRGGSVMPTWTIHCPDCGERVYTTDRAEEVAERFHENDDILLECRECGVSVDDGDVRKDGEPVDKTTLPTVYLPSEHQNRVFLHASKDPSPSLRGFEWVPETMKLTSLPGIGDATAERLGDDVLAIDDMLADGGLAPAVKRVVPTRHTELERELLDRYEDALAARAGDDLDRFRRVVEVEPDDWWHPIERVGGQGPIDQLCRSLYEEVRAGDRLAIEFADRAGTYRATVQENRSVSNKLLLDLKFDRPVEGFGEEGGLNARWSSYWPNPKVDFYSLEQDIVWFGADRLQTERVEVLETDPGATAGASA